MAGTLASTHARVAAILTKAGCPEPRRRARQLIADLLDIPRADVLLRSQHLLNGATLDRIFSLAERVAGGEPLSRALGHREFWGLDFALSDDTLDPRPETETLVEAALARFPDRDNEIRLLDLGTGTGCLVLALLSEYPRATGLGVDCSVGAAVTARRNAAALGLAARARFVVGDWTSALACRFDVIVANPPYIATAALADLPQSVSRYDPCRALDGGEDGLAAYRRIAPGLSRFLMPGGIFAAEIGAGQGDAVAKIMKEAGLRVDATERDLAGIERCVLVSDGGFGRPRQKNLGMSSSHR